MHDTPLIFAGPMWGELVDWARNYMLRPTFELANPEDMEIPQCVNDADAAITLIREFHARWKEQQGAS
jgi:hypothetical protein